MKRWFLLLLAAPLVLPTALAQTEAGTMDAPADKRINIIVDALQTVAPAGYKASGAVERYDVNNIYDKINGRSELHMAYGVVGLAFLHLEPNDGDGAPVEVYVYDMGSTLGAFGAYSVERWAEGEPIDLGRGGYRHRDDLNFWHGDYYVNLVGREDDEGTEAAKVQIAKTLVSRLEDRGEPLWGAAWLPMNNRVDNSLQYYMEDALSLDFLGDTFTAKYLWDGTEYTVFVSRQADVDAAEKVMDQLRAYHERYSESVETVTKGDSAYLVAAIGGGFFDVASAVDGYVVGVTTAEGRDETLAAMDLLHAHAVTREAGPAAE